MTWQHVGELRGHRGAANCLSAAGEVLASGGKDGTIRLWDVAAGRSTRALLSSGQRPVNAVCVGVGGCEHYVLAAAGREVFAYDLRAPGIVLRQPAVPSLGRAREEVSSLALDAAGRYAALADDSGEVRLVDLEGEAHPPALQAAHGSLCSCVQFRPSAGLEVLSGGMDACVLRWHGGSGQLLRSWSLAPPSEQQPAQLVNPRFVHALAYAPGGACFAAALGDGAIELRGAAECELLATAAEAHCAAASQVLFAAPLAHLLPGGGAGGAIPLLSAGDDSQLRLWAVHASSPGAGEPRQDPSASAGPSSLSSPQHVSIRPAGGVRLSNKPNALALCQGVVCVADTSDRLALLRPDPLAGLIDQMDLS